MLVKSSLITLFFGLCVLMATLVVGMTDIVNSKNASENGMKRMAGHITAGTGIAYLSDNSALSKDTSFLFDAAQSSDLEDDGTHTLNVPGWTLVYTAPLNAPTQPIYSVSQKGCEQNFKTNPNGMCLPLSIPVIR
jgi:hypothetical protein